MLTLKKKIIASFEAKCVRKLIYSSFLEHKTNDWVWSKINFLMDPQEPLLATVKRRKLAWFRHVTHHDSLSKTIIWEPWRVGNTMFGRGNSGWTTSKSGHTCPYQNCSQGPPAEKTGRESLLTSPSCPSPPSPTTLSIKGLN